MAKILVSYRRMDSAGITGRIFDRLVGRYGADRVFMDVDNIPFGTDFRDHIRNSLVASDVLLAVVGPQWLGRQAGGESRIRQDTDPVRIEIETALQAGVPVIPVLVDGATMPAPADLPDTLNRFCYLNAATVESGRDFHHQVDRIIRSIDRILEAAPGPAPAPTEAPPAPSRATATAAPPTPPAAAAAAGSRAMARRVLLVGAGTAALGGAAWWAMTSLPWAPPPTGPTLGPPDPPPPTGGPTPPAGGSTAGGILRIAVAGPMTGPSAAFGVQMKSAVELARDDINAAGGVLGQKIEIIARDDESEPRQGSAIANALGRERVSFVVGHFNSSVTIPASEAYRDNNILQITPASTNPRVTERGLWNIFRTCGRDDQQGMVAGAYIVKNLRTKRVAVVHDKTTYGKNLADDTKKTMNAGDVREVLYETVNVGDKDFAALISKIRAARADLIYWGGLDNEAGPMLRQMRAAGVNAVLMSGDGIASDEFANLGGPAVEGTLMTFGRDPSRRPEARAVMAKLRAKNVQANGYVFHSYAAVEIFQQSIEAAKSTEPRKVADTMRSGRTFPTVLGDISYDLKGDITQADYVIYVWKKDASGKMSFVELDQ